MDFWIILWVLLISIGINIAFFIVAYVIKTDIFTDVTYSATFIILSVIIAIWKRNFSPLQITLFILYNLWAIRTGSYLLIRILKTKKDSRFDNIRDNFLKFGCFWILQGLTVFIVSLPTIFALSISKKYFAASFNFYTLFFIILALVFLVIEAIADWQKFSFHIKNQSQKNSFINYGLWKDSRHPNYLGEIGFWYMLLGCSLLDYLLNNNQSYLMLLFVLSPLYLNLLLIKVSGVPILELKAAKKLKNNNLYLQYINNTPCVLFFIGKKGEINKVKKLKNK